ncbi:MAG TPA: hypothetical protein VF797_13560 [Noviherbaspirillum sp.]
MILAYWRTTIGNPVLNTLRPYKSGSGPVRWTKARGESGIRRPADATGKAPVSADSLLPIAICTTFPHCIETVIELLHDGKNGHAIVWQPISPDRKLIYLKPGKAAVSGSNRENSQMTMQITIDKGLSRTLFQLPCTKFRNTIMQRISL